MWLQARRTAARLSAALERSARQPPPAGSCRRIPNTALTRARFARATSAVVVLAMIKRRAAATRSGRRGITAIPVERGDVGAHLVLAYAPSTGLSLSSSTAR